METRTAMVDRRPVRGWKLWTLPLPAVSFLLAVDLAAIGYALWLLLDDPAVGDLRVAILLLLCAIVGSEGARQVEQRRRRGGALHKDLQSVWILAAVILLTPAAAVVFALISRSWWRLRAGRCVPYRWAFSTAVIVLGIGAAHASYHGLAAALTDLGWAVSDSTVLAMALAAVAFLGVDAVLCAIAIRLLDPESSLRDAFGEPADLGVDLIGGGLGCTVAAAGMISPWFLLFVLPVTLTAQRALLLHQFEL
ncbi:MAG TPA: GGDEF domain-containing protein, partial [Actinopolymorphaceae bacterium]